MNDPSPTQPAWLPHGVSPAPAGENRAVVHAPQPLRSWQSIVSYGFYPLVVMSTVGLSVALLRTGFSEKTVMPLTFVYALLVTSLTEQILPFDRGPKRARIEQGQDILFIALAAVIQKLSSMLFHSISMVVGVSIVTYFARPAAEYPWGIAIVAFLLGDLGKYLVHRWSHESAWLWRFHRAHHTPTRVVVLNGLRFHPVNLMWNLLFDMALPMLMGLGGQELVILGAFRASISVMQHANVDARLGVLSWIFSTPALHRWHHSARIEESSSNYGATLILWDVLFHTRSLPSARSAPDAYGVEDPKRAETSQ